MNASDTVVIMPAHNRADRTVAALSSLRDDGVNAFATILVVDDGSTDGTVERVAGEFPEIPMLRGNGTWWWGGCIRRGMEWALARGASRCVWLNDDCRPAPGSLRRLVDRVGAEGCVCWIGIVCPSGWSYAGHRVTAFGIRRSTTEEEHTGACDTFSGNCVAMPLSLVARAGLPDDAAFPQGFCDLDYGLRLKAVGARLASLPDARGEGADPARFNRESWLLSGRGMLEIWRDFSSPRSYLHFRSWRRFALRHWRPLPRGAFVFALPYLRWTAIACVRTVTTRNLRLRLFGPGRFGPDSTIESN